MGNINKLISILELLKTPQIWRQMKNLAKFGTKMTKGVFWLKITYLHATKTKMLQKTIFWIV
jgi:hypothetical protein